MKKIIQVLRLATDILFPEKGSVIKLEKMSAREVEERISKADLVKNHEKDFFALFRYHDPLAKQMVWEIKYRGNSKIADLAGYLIGKKLIEKLFQDTQMWNRSEVIIIPIPISKKRLKQRGYSQTELLAKAVVKNLPENFSYQPDILIKTKDTPSQTSLGNRSQRLSNLSGAFSLKDSAAEETIRGKNIVLIDDVITTGATLEEVCGVLLDAGAKSVTAFAIAH